MSAKNLPASASAALPLHRLAVPDAATLPFTVGTFDQVGPLSRAPFPHRHTFYEVMLVTRGTGEHVIEFTGHRLRPPHLGFIAPGRVHHWRGATGLDGRVLLFTGGFLLDHPDDRASWEALATQPWLPLTASQETLFAGLLDGMEREHRQRDTGFHGVLQAYLHVFLVQARRLADAVPGARRAANGADGRATATAREFTALITSEPAPVRSYADRLGVSVGHLTEAVKAATGRTPGQLIREATVLEARRLLGGTDLTVGQISRRLGFGDPAYFCRFFRREAGTTPGGFRRALDGNHHDPRIQSIDPPEPGE